MSLLQLQEILITTLDLRYFVTSIILTVVGILIVMTFYYKEFVDIQT